MEKGWVTDHLGVKAEFRVDVSEGMAQDQEGTVEAETVLEAT